VRDTISIDDWPKIERWLLAASDVPSLERAAFIEAACPATLQPLVKSLLRSLDERTMPGDLILAPETVAQLADTQPDVTDAARLPLSRVGTYRLIRHLGSGGMGSVYLGQSILYPKAKPVAVKLLRRDLYAPETERRFRRERMILAALKHPGIAAFLDAGSTREGWPYYAMEYVEGTSLIAYAGQRGLDLDARLDLMEAACEPIAYAHRQRVIHCDLKPSNLFVTYGTGTIKVLDFGIAKILRPHVENEHGLVEEDSFLFLTQFCDGAHTQGYAAPEQLAGGQLGTEADVFALGQVGRKLVSSAAGVETSELATACQKVWDRATEAYPKDRYSTASVLLAALRRARSSISGRQSPKSQLPGASGSSLR
jgi:serine/threonine-protein kinase